MQPPLNSDDGLLSDLRRDKQLALANCFVKYRERLLAAVRRRLDKRLSRRLDAEDVLQEAFHNAHKKLPTFVPDRNTSVYVWLHGIVADLLGRTRHYHLKVQKRNASKETPMWHSSGAQPGGSKDAVPVVLSTPSQAAVRRERTELVNRAMGMLEESDRQALDAIHTLQLTHEQAGEAVGVSANTHAHRYRRALSKFKKVMKQITEDSSFRSSKPT